MLDIYKLTTEKIEQRVLEKIQDAKIDEFRINENSLQMVLSFPEVMNKVHIEVSANGVYKLNDTRKVIIISEYSDGVFVGDFEILIANNVLKYEIDKIVDTKIKSFGDAPLNESLALNKEAVSLLTETKCDHCINDTENHYYALDVKKATVGELTDIIGSLNNYVKRSRGRPTREELDAKVL